MSSYSGESRAFDDQGIVSAEKNKPRKHRARVRKAAAPAIARGRGRPPKHSGFHQLAYNMYRPSNVMPYNLAPYPTSPPPPMYPTPALSPQPQRRRSSPFRLPIAKAVSQWNTARWRQLTMLTAKLKKESGGRVDKMELNKQLEIWERMVPKPESPGDCVFLAMKPEPSKVPESECTSEQAQHDTQQLSASTQVGREDTLHEAELPYTSANPYTETNCELVEWLLANLPSTPASHWYESEKLCTSHSFDTMPMADYHIPDLSLQQDRGLFREESQVPSLLCTNDYEALWCPHTPI